ncbi:hypothetical protein [Cognatishimia sp. F0-27]|nr:hypothetical protein [Cognatishimia sp. F0-27]MCC1493833.1 hypothetical protein [Cognatishimia sp. F0-27]
MALTAQGRGLSITGARKHRREGPEAEHAPTLKPDHSMGTARRNTGFS